MGKLFIMAIPPELIDVWWVYHIILGGIIAVSLVILSFFKKRSPEKEGSKLSKRAENYLERVSVGKIRSIIKIKTAKNLLSSAQYYFKEAVKEKEIYQLRLKIDAIEDLLPELDILSAEENKDEFNTHLCEVINKLKSINK
jgi:hypothetical protein